MPFNDDVVGVQMSLNASNAFGHFIGEFYKFTLKFEFKSSKFLCFSPENQYDGANIILV
jgi:hypothetical protein